MRDEVNKTLNAISENAGLKGVFLDLLEMDTAKLHFQPGRSAP